MRDNPKTGIHGYAEISTFEENFTTRGLGGFKLHYSLSAMVRRVNDREFKAYKMWTPERQSELMQELNYKFFSYLHSIGGSFAFCWTSIMRLGDDDFSLCPTAMLFERKVIDGIPKLSMDVCGSSIKEFRTQEYVRYGCKPEIQLIKNVNLWDEEQIERNYNMLTPEQIEGVAKDEHYHTFIAQTVIVAMKRRLELLRAINKIQSEQHHENGGIIIDAVQDEKKVIIQWQFKDEYKSGYSLKGFRRTDSFYENEWDEKCNGAFVIDSHHNGEHLEQLEEGRSYFYTFFLERWKDGQKSHPIRFSFRIPTKAETEKVEHMFTEIARIRAPQDPENEEVAMMLKEISDDIRKHEALLDYKKKQTKIIKEKGLSPEDEADDLERLSAMLEYARIKYLK